jgi:hypothetical protein
MFFLGVCQTIARRVMSDAAMHVITHIICARKVIERGFEPSPPPDMPIYTVNTLTTELPAPGFNATKVYVIF